MGIYGHKDIQSEIITLIESKIQELEAENKSLDYDADIYKKIIELESRLKNNNISTYFKDVDFRNIHRDFDVSKAQEKTKENVEQIQLLKNLLADNLEVQVLSQKNSAQITCKRQPYIKIGGCKKPFTALFFDNEGKRLNNISPVWDVKDIEKGLLEIEYKDNKILVAAKNQNSLIGTEFKLTLTNENQTCHDEIIVKIESFT